MDTYWSMAEHNNTEEGKRQKYCSTEFQVGGEYSIDEIES